MRYCKGPVSLSEWVAASFLGVGQQGVEDITPPPSQRAVAFAVASEVELGFSPASKPAEQRPTLCRRLERSPKGEATDSIAVVFACFIFLHFSPKNRMSSPGTT
jgi:hypothetical protein